ncbi:uncharacterized protein LOC117322795 [Pecten maximus]|uniref:uncharacterized protein LOC117322795 n=1 Tax=Pecten maximus TaxID=6579 RepID=UPI001458F4F4|nr:uncharacterized protein LOC117322795 [Pecten maximus]
MHSCEKIWNYVNTKHEFFIVNKYDLVKVNPQGEALRTKDTVRANEEEDEIMDNEPNDFVSNQPAKRANRRSPATNIDQRIAVRSLWRQVVDPAIKLVFTLGSVTGPKWRIEQESRLYHDILQESFDDHLNSTLKIVMSYSWAVRYCPMADLLLFLNDNFYVELNKMAAYLRVLMENNSRDMYIGKVVSYVPPYRDQSERLFFPFEWYMSDGVPSFVRGGAYAVTYDVAQKINMAFPYVKYLNIDDVYVGIVADKLSIRPLNDDRFDPNNNNALVWECSDVATELLQKNCPLSGKNRQKLIDYKEEVQFNSKYNTTNRYLYYGMNFSYPLHIDLLKCVSAAISQNEPIPHEPINPHPFHYLHRPPSCAFPQDPNGNKNILIMVKSFVGNFELRQAIRSVWEKIGDSHIKRVFTLGYRDTNQSMVQLESKKYKDLIQEDYLDAYLNNTLKTIMSFNWAVKFCRTADFVFFVDDDYYVKERQLAGYLRSLKRKKDLLLGRLVIHAPPYRGKEKWHLTYQQYPYNRFPPYLSGGAFVASFDVVRKFYFAFPYVKYLGLDDVYLGIVAKKLSVIPRNETYFDSANDFAIAKECSHDPQQLLNEQCTLIGYVIPTTEEPLEDLPPIGVMEHVKRLIHVTLSGLTKMIASNPAA